MPILIDGNNLLHTLPRAARSRAEVRRQVLDQVRNRGTQITVVFDGAPPAGTPQREALGQVTIVYSGATSADDVIVRLLPPGKVAKNWLVVSDDRDLAERVRRGGAEVCSLGQWRRRQARPQRPRRPQVERTLSANEVQEWEAYFSASPDRTRRSNT